MICRAAHIFASSSFLNIYLFDWLGLSCGLWILSCGMQTPSCGMWDLVSWPRIKPGHWERGVLVTGLPGKSHLCFLRLQRVCVLRCSVVLDSLQTPWTVAHQALLSIRFSRKKYWIGLLFPPPGDLPDPGIEPLAGRFFITEPPGNPKAIAQLFKKSPLVLERLPGFFIIISFFTIHFTHIT